MFYARVTNVTKYALYVYASRIWLPPPPKNSLEDRSEILELFNEELVPLYKGDTLIHDTRVKMHDTWCVHEQLLERETIHKSITYSYLAVK